MAFKPGDTFGAYTVGPLLGSGGMGEVYQARDTRLNRHVALKVLPDAVAHDPDRLARFTREAQALAALNHPRIAQIYGLEQVEDRGALVLELVEGQTLADRLVRGPFPLDEALTIASQIAEALEAAHDAGIVHRDLKPANIKITNAGAVKVLDFGLAKAIEVGAGGGAGRASGDHVSLSPTITVAGTRAGMIIGTAAYMSPEQARGTHVDKRADVWAFGCVLFEMLTGRSAFGADTVPDTVVRVLSVEPDLQSLPGRTPAALVALLKRCLQKDPTRRLRDIGDARLQLEEIAASGTPMVVSDPPRSRPRRFAYAGWIAAALASALGVLAVLWTRADPSTQSVLRLNINTPVDSQIDGRPLAARFALSPDARRIVHAGPVEGGVGLWIRSLDQEDGRPLMGTALADRPFWSPDGRSIGFTTLDGFLKRVDVDGGFVRTVAPAPNAREAMWGPGDAILFGASAGPLNRVAADGGSVRQVTTLLPGQSSHRMPRFLPDGQRFLFLAIGMPDVRGIYVANLDGSGMRRIADTDAPYEYLPPSHILRARDGALWAQKLNADVSGVEGPLIPVASRVFVDGTVNGLAAIATSASGAIAYRARAGLTQLVWLDRAGRDVATVTEPDDSQMNNVALSDDGRVAAVRRMVNGNTDVWLYDTARGLPRRLTVDPAIDGEPVFSPDSLRVAYASDPKGGLWDLYERATDGTGSERALLEGPVNESPRDWSPDGKYVLVAKQNVQTDFDLWAVPVEPGQKPFAVAETRFAESDAQISPDGRWVAFDSNDTGRREIFVQPFPGPGARIQISNGGGQIPRWRRDGRELFFISNGTLVAIDLDTRGSTVTTGARRTLFPMPSLQWYSPSADGQRFLVNRPISAPAPITLLLNWRPTQ